MPNEEEKKAIEILNSWYNYNKKNRNKLLEADKIIKVQETILNLIEKQQKELNNLKEIEQRHREVNGKLRVELEQYKLLEANIDKANKIIAENKFDEGLYGLLMQEKEKNKELEDKQIWNKGRIEELKKELEQEKASNKFDKGLYGLFIKEEEKNKDHTENKELVNQALGLPKDADINETLQKIVALNHCISKEMEAIDYMYDLLNTDIPNVGTVDINNLLSILEEK